MPSKADIARPAHAQHGNVAFWQHRGLDFSSDAIRHRAATGRLIRRYRGVYACGYVRTDFLSRASAARLAAGRSICLSGTAAAAVYRSLPEPSGPVHLILSTSPARTLLDLAASESERTLLRAYNEFQVLKLLTRSQVEAMLPRYNGRRGVAVLEALVNDHLGATRSVLEDIFVPLIRQSNLPFPSLNAAVLGLEVDAVWSAHKLIVELDGRRFHDTDPRFESDRARDAS